MWLVEGACGAFAVNVVTKAGAGPGSAWVIWVERQVAFCRL